MTCKWYFLEGVPAWHFVWYEGCWSETKPAAWNRSNQNLISPNSFISFHIARKLSDPWRTSLLASFIYYKINFLSRCSDSHGKTYEIQKLQNPFVIYIEQVPVLMRMVTAELRNNESGRSFNNNNNNNNIYLLRLVCYPVAVVILHVHKTWNWLLLNLSR